MPNEQKATLQRIYKELEDLRPVRNFLVHGETWDGAFKGKPRQAYRVGLVKKNLEYLDEFECAEHGPNVFDVEQARAATKRCAEIHRDLTELRDAIAATAIPFEEDVTPPRDAASFGGAMAFSDNAFLAKLREHADRARRLFSNP